MAYKLKIEDHFTYKDPPRVWQGIQQITNYRSSYEPLTNISASLAEKLNHFYACFETTEMDNGAILISPHEVRCIFKSINTRKAEGPDGIPGKVFRDCAFQLLDVFAVIFVSVQRHSTSLLATIIPVPKQSNINTLDDYRPVALNPIIAKCIERLVMMHRKSVLPSTWTSTSMSTGQTGPQTTPSSLPYTQL